MKKLIPIFLVLFLNINAKAQEQCAELFKQKPHEIFKQLLESKSPSQLLRSNAEQYWAWAKFNSQNYFKEASNILKITGRVVGDPHNKNFGIVSYMKKLIWTVVDSDDAGSAPMILDFTRFVAAIKAVEDIKTKDLWSYYVAGLTGQEITVPAIVQKYLNMPYEDFRALEVKKANKFADESLQKLKNDGVESSSISSKKDYDKVKNEFEKAFASMNWQVLDVGGREKDRGGSQEALRFVALVRETDGFNTVFELKEDLGTSVDQYQHQSHDNLERTLDDYIYSHVRSKTSNKDLSYQVVKFKIEGKDRTFLLRRKQLYFFDAANSVDTKKEEDEFGQLSIYNAWFMGRLHGQQSNSRAYVSAIQNDTDGKIFDGVKQMAKSYLDLLVSELKDAKKDKKKNNL